MKDNITAIIIVSVIRITGLCFAILGVYVMLQGFIKTGVFLIVGAILGSFFTKIKIDNNSENKQTEEG